MRVAYVSDQRFYEYKGRWYTTASLPLADLAAAFGPQGTHWTLFGRLIELEMPPIDLYPIEWPETLSVEFAGLRGQARGIAAYLRTLPAYLRAARRAIRSGDVVWLKLPFVSSYLLTLLPRPRRQWWMTHQVGDPHLSLRAALGNRYRPLAVLAKWFTHLAVQRADLALFVSESLRSKYGARHRFARVINEARVRRADMVTEPRTRPAGAARVVYVGRLSPEKRVDVLVDAVRRLVDRGVPVQLDVIGDGPTRASLQQQIAAGALGDAVRLVGTLPWGSALFAALRQCHVLVLPSQTEGLPLVLVEGMSQGLPCVGTRVGGIPEIIRDGENGRLVEPGDPAGLADAIAWVCDPVRYEALSRESLQTAQAHCFEAQLSRLTTAVAQMTAGAQRI